MRTKKTDITHTAISKRLGSQQFQHCCEPRSLTPLFFQQFYLRGSANQMKVKGGLRKKYFQTEEELRSSTEVITQSGLS